MIRGVLFDKDDTLLGISLRSGAAPVQRSGFMLRELRRENDQARSATHSNVPLDSTATRSSQNLPVVATAPMPTSCAPAWTCGFGCAELSTS